MEPVAIFGVARFRGGVSLAGAKRLDQAAVLHARGAGRLATAAIEAQVEMLGDFARQFEPSVDNRAHQVNPPAGTVVFVSRLEIRRAGGRAQATVHAIEKELVRDTGARRRSDASFA